MRKALIVYFSRTGYTQKVAEAIAAQCDADVERIQEARGRSGILGYLRSAREALKKALIEIQPAAKDPQGYEVVVLGTPVWAGKISSPLRAYVMSQRGQFGQVAFFCTQHSSGAERVFNAMADLCSKQPLASVAFNDEDIRRERHWDKLKQFVNAIAEPNGSGRR